MWHRGAHPWPYHSRRCRLGQTFDLGSGGVLPSLWHTNVIP